MGVPSYNNLTQASGNTDSTAQQTQPEQQQQKTEQEQLQQSQQQVDRWGQPAVSKEEADRMYTEAMEEQYARMEGGA